MSWLPAPITLPVPDARRAAQDDVRLEGHVGAELDRPVEVDRGRVAHRDAVAHVRLVEPDPQAPLGGGQLRAVVDAVEPAVVLEGDRADDPAVLAGEPDELGQVQLAGRGRRRQGLDPAAQPGGIERVEPGVDLVAGELVGRRRPSPRRSARPSRTRRGRRARARPGRRRRRWPARSRRRPARRASRTASRSAPVTSGTSPDSTRISVASAGTTAERRAHRVAGPARLVLEGERRPVGERRR